MLLLSAATVGACSTLRPMRQEQPEGTTASGSLSVPWDDLSDHGAWVLANVELARS